MIINGNKVYAKQLNLEKDTVTGAKVTNNGGTFWVLGLKTETKGTIVKTTNLGKSEVLGAHINTPSGGSGTSPMFIIDNSSASFANVRETHSSTFPFNPVVVETRLAVTDTLAATEAPGGNGTNASYLPLFIGYCNGAQCITSVTQVRRSLLTP
jgi:hypothetical protein